MADSRLLLGGIPVAMIASSCTGSSLQLSLVMVTNPPGPCSSITGSANALATPTWVSEGPMARRSKCLGALPVMMRPPMPTLAPVRTFMRVERFWACAGVADGVTVGAGDGVTPGVGVGGATVAVAVAVAVAVGVAEGVALGAMVAVAVAVGVAVAVAVAVGVGVAPLGRPKA